MSELLPLLVSFFRHNVNKTETGTIPSKEGYLCNNIIVTKGGYFLFFL